MRTERGARLFSSCRKIKNSNTVLLVRIVSEAGSQRWKADQADWNCALVEALCAVTRRCATCVPKREDQTALRNSTRPKERRACKKLLSLGQPDAEVLSESGIGRPLFSRPGTKVQWGATER